MTFFPKVFKVAIFALLAKGGPRENGRLFPSALQAPKHHQLKSPLSLISMDLKPDHHRCLLCRKALEKKPIAGEMTFFPKVSKVAIFALLAKGGPRENGRLLPSALQAPKHHQLKSPLSLISMDLKPDHHRCLLCRKALEKKPIAGEMTFFPKVRKVAIFALLAKGGPRENGRLLPSALQAPKHHQLKSPLNLISMDPKPDHHRCLLCRKALEKKPIAGEMTFFPKVSKVAIFALLAKGGPRENGRLLPSALQAPKHHQLKSPLSLISMDLKPDHHRCLLCRKALEKKPIAGEMTFFPKVRKVAIFALLAKGGPRENGRLLPSALQAPKHHQLKSPLNLISMDPKPDHHRCLLCRKALEKKPIAGEMTFFPKVSKVAIFALLAKGGPRENGRLLPSALQAPKHHQLKSPLNLISMDPKPDHHRCLLCRKALEKKPIAGEMTFFPKVSKVAIFALLAKGGPRENGRLFPSALQAPKHHQLKSPLSLISMDLNPDHHRCLLCRKALEKKPIAGEMTFFPKVSKVAIFALLAKGGPRENGRLLPSALQAPKHHQLKSPLSLISMDPKPDHHRCLLCRKALEKKPIAGEMTFFPKVSKVAIFALLAKGGPRENGRLLPSASQAPKHHQLKSPLSLISMDPKPDHHRCLLCRKALEKKPIAGEMTFFPKVRKVAIFAPLAKGGPRENGRLLPSASQAPKHHQLKSPLNLISMDPKPDYHRCLLCRKALEKKPIAGEITFFPKVSKVAIFALLAKGYQGKMADFFPQLCKLQNITS